MKAAAAENNSNSKLSFVTTTGLVIGCVIGSGVFVKPGVVLTHTGNSSLALLAWILGGFITVTAGLTLAEIASRSQRTGGVAAYMEEMYGKGFGFMCGWVQAIIYGPALFSALALFFGTLFTQFFGMEDSMVRPVAIAALFGLALANSMGTRFGAAISNLTTFIKLVPIILLSLAGIFLGQEPIFSTLANSTGEAVKRAGMGAAILATLWAYDGWVIVASLASEIKEPQKTLPRALITGLIVVMLAYLGVNLGLIHTLGVDQIAALNEKAASVAAVQIFGPAMGGFLGLAVLVSIFGCLNGNLMSFPWVAYSMAKEKNFPFANLLARLGGTGTPVNSLIMKVTVALLMLLLLDPNRITDIAIFSMYLFYGAIFLGVFALRKKLGAPLPGQYRVPLYPLVPMVAVFGCVYICYSMAAQAPIDALVSLAVAAAGGLYYWKGLKSKG